MSIPGFTAPPTSISTGSKVSRRTLFRLGAGTAAAVAVPSILGGCSPGNLSGTGATPAKLSRSPAKSLSGEVTIWDRQGDLFKVFDHAIKGSRRSTRR
jgi:lactose/L-arabinose transport system substrate-binding protein